MSHDEREVIKQEVAVDVHAQLSSVIDELRGPAAKALRARLANLFFTSLTFLMVAGTTAYGWSKLQQFGALLETPKQIETAKAALATQISAVERDGHAMFETKEHHKIDTVELRGRVDFIAGESAVSRARIEQTLENQNRQLTSMGNSIQSIQTTLSNRSAKQP